jgi:CHAT domain-containing protein
VSSLASAFIQAGSKNVIMSLWKIDDEATSKLIKAFYGMIAQGKNYKDALRGAKLTMIEQDPFYWSALTLHGV